MKKLVVLTMALAVVCVLCNIVYADLNDGLVAYFPFNGNANDESGNGNHGTEYGGVSYENGVVGKAANFDGVDNYIETLNEVTVDTNEPRTVCAWVYLRSTGQGRGIVQLDEPGKSAASLYNLRVQSFLIN